MRWDGFHAAIAARNPRASVTLDVSSHILLDEPRDRLEELRARAVSVLSGPSPSDALNAKGPASGANPSEVEDIGLEPMTSTLPA